MAVVGDEEVDVAVVVVVAGADALSPALAAESRLRGDVGEGPIAWLRYRWLIGASSPDAVQAARR